jgi:hypothetical protein
VDLALKKKKERKKGSAPDLPNKFGPSWILFLFFFKKDFFFLFFSSTLCTKEGKFG